MSDAEYITRELSKAGESESYKIKVMGDDGESRWLTIDPEAFARVREALTNPDSGDLLSVHWAQSSGKYCMHARPGGSADWTTTEFSESDVDEMLSIGRDIMTGG